MRGTTDRPTVLNIVNHAYWNLGGQGAGGDRPHALSTVSGSTSCS
jgi:aldose 1-epimerase